MDTKGGDLFEVVSWDAVSVWSWDLATESCAICQTHIMFKCIDCQANLSRDIDCTVAWGECNHAFHHHCISRWLETRQTCPLDSKPWVFKKHGK